MIDFLPISIFRISIKMNRQSIDCDQVVFEFDNSNLARINLNKLNNQSSRNFIWFGYIIQNSQNICNIFSKQLYIILLLFFDIFNRKL